MFKVSYSKDVKLSELDQQALAYQFAGTLDKLLKSIEEVLDALGNVDNPEMAPLLKQVVVLLKNHLRNGIIRADWDDSDGGGEVPTPVSPVPVLTSFV